MTTNLNSTTRLGHFLVLLLADHNREDIMERVRRLRPEISGGKVPPAVREIGSHGLAAAWGGASIEQAGDSTLIGVMQPARHDGRACNAAGLREFLENGATGPIGSERLPGGNFSAVMMRNHEPKALAVTSPFRQLPLYRASLGDITAFATDVRLITELGLVPAKVDIQALYHYLNFSCVPAPYSIFEKVRKVPAGTLVRAMPGTTVEERYWQPKFEGDIDGREEILEERLREKLYSTVRGYRPVNGERWGTFLSGGTDSSSITGILATEAGRDPVRTFSIGFAEEGYDELEFARIAAKHFRTDPRYRNVGEQDTLNAIPRLLEAYDEPYGNASAIPTFYCASIAADEGVNTLIAGDGGDESFGGNERYAKDAVYRNYGRLPRRLRQRIATMLSGESKTGSLLENRIRHFAERGSLDNPERFYMEESFASDYFDELLSPALQSQLKRDSSLGLVQGHYDECPADDELHRLMYVDLMMAIADNDLVKVQRAAQAAGVAVTYPYLDPDLVAHAGRLHSHWKVKGLRKRYLFKRALRDLLPEAIIRKPKQGFGLPIALWTRRNGPFRELMQDTLRSQRAAERGYFDQDFVEGLLDTHDRGGWDLSPELWRLLMLELWQREYVDAA